MKKMAIAVGAVALGAALGFAPVASATEADYVAALAAAGVGPEATIVGSIPSAANGISPQQAQQIYDAANNHLCAG